MSHDTNFRVTGYEKTSAGGLLHNLGFTFQLIAYPIVEGEIKHNHKVLIGVGEAEFKEFLIAHRTRPARGFVRLYCNWLPLTWHIMRVTTVTYGSLERVHWFAS